MVVPSDSIDSKQKELSSSAGHKHRLRLPGTHSSFVWSAAVFLLLLLTAFASPATLSLPSQRLLLAAQWKIQAAR